MIIKLHLDENNFGKLEARNKRRLRKRKRRDSRHKFACLQQILQSLQRGLQACNFVIELASLGLSLQTGFAKICLLGFALQVGSLAYGQFLHIGRGGVLFYPDGFEFENGKVHMVSPRYYRNQKFSRGHLILTEKNIF